MSTAYDFEVQTDVNTRCVVVYLRETKDGERIRYVAEPVEGVYAWGTGLLVLHQLGMAWVSPPWPLSGPAPGPFRVLDEIKALEKDCPAIKAALDEIEFRKALDTAALHKLQYSMEERLACKRLEGRKGWEDAPEQVLRDLFYDAVARDSLIGAANYLAFMHQRGISLLPAPPQKVKLQIEVDTTQATAKVKELRDAIYPTGGPISTGMRLVGEGPTIEHLRRVAEPDPVEQECKVQIKPEPDPILQRLDHIIELVRFDLARSSQ